MPSAEYPSVSVGLETGLTVGRREGEGGMAGRAHKGQWRESKGTFWEGERRVILTRTKAS